jgi:pentatricopeptide repeat protein
MRLPSELEPSLLQKTTCTMRTLRRVHSNKTLQLLQQNSNLKASFCSSASHLDLVSSISHANNAHGSSIVPAKSWKNSHLHHAGMRRNFTSHMLETLGIPTASRKNYFREDEARELTDLLCNPLRHKIGSFTKERWHQTVQLLRFWTKQNTSESVEAAFALLHRLLQEQEVLFRTALSTIDVKDQAKLQLMTKRERLEMQALSEELLDTDILNHAVQNWQVCWKNQNTKLSPKLILYEIEGCIEKSQSLLPDTKTYNMVMDALSRRFDRKSAVQFAEKIFQKMLMDSRTIETIPQSAASSTNDADGDQEPQQQRRKLNIAPDEYTYSTLINIYSRAGDAKAAEDVLSKMHKEYQAGRSNIQPNVRTFTAVISAWARSRAPDAPEKAESILEIMHMMDKSGSLDNCRPNIVTYNCLLDVWSKCKREDGGERAEAVLGWMEDNTALQPDAISYNTVIAAWLHTGSCDVARAEAVLKRMTLAYKHKRNSKARPDLDSYKLLLKALQENCTREENAATRAERLLKQMQSVGVAPDLVSYNAVLACWAQSGHAQAGARAERLLKEMRDRVKVQPNTLSYNSAITANARNGKPRRAEIIFKAMYDEYRRGNRNVQPQLRTFNAVLAAWSHSPTVTDAERVNAIMNLMRELPRSGVIGVKPDIVSYNTLLSCLSKLDTDDARDRAEKLLQEMESGVTMEGAETIIPDKLSYTNVMKAHARAGDIKKTREVLKRMFQQVELGNDKAKPDVVTFNCILQAIYRNSKGKNRDAGYMAEEVFKEMRDLHAAGKLDGEPDKMSYEAKINCWANSGHPEAGEHAEAVLRDLQRLSAKGSRHLQPDAISFSSVINAYAKAGNDTRAEELLKEMLAEYSRGNMKLKPTTQTINTVLASLARSKEPGAAARAEVYLREMLAHDGSSLDLSPDAVTFSTVITAWANSGDPMAAERAKALFREIEMQRHTPEGRHIRLDAGFYRSVLRACANAGEFAIAEALLHDITTGEQDRRVKPDKYMYHALLQAYAKSEQNDAAEKAEALLRQMNSLASSNESLDVKPDTLCYLSVLECWANSMHKQLAIDRSEAILCEMEERAESGDESVKPSPATYSR